jgi:uncharacterized membrane protein
MRIVLAIAGALLGLRLADGPRELFGVFAGAAIGWVCAEIFALRRRLRAMERETQELRQQVGRRTWRDEAEASVEARSQEPAAPDPQTATQSHPASDPISEASWREFAAHGAQQADDPVRQTPGEAAEATHARAQGADVQARQTSGTLSAASLRESASHDRAQQADEHGRQAPDARSRAVAYESAAQSRTPQPSQTPSVVSGAQSSTGAEHVLDGAQPARDYDVVRTIREYFTSGNTLVRVGIVILLFGVAFLLRYVAERTRVPIELRLTGVALVAIVLLILGWKLRTRREGYALALQGGAVGILYLLVFVSLRLYSVLPPSAAFVLLILLGVFSATLAVLQSSIELAVLGIVGGFLAPILASTGQGSHIVLFSYYAVLNAGIVGIAWFKAWRLLNVLGFLFTFVIGIIWGVLRYQSSLFASTEPFLILFFLFYVAIAILFASRQPPQLKGYVDGGIVFGTPIVVFGLQSALLRDSPYELAFSALAMSALYLLLAWWLYRLHRETYRLLVESFMALGVVFVTLAIPLALDGHWSAATWALEGAALVWVGCRQNRKLPRVTGALLQIAAGIIFWRDVHAPQSPVPILNSEFLGGLMLAAAGVFAARTLSRNREKLAPYESHVPQTLFLWGLAWWLLAGLEEASRLPDRYMLAVDLLFITFTALLSSAVERRLDLPIAKWPALALLPVMYLFALAAAILFEHPFMNLGWIAWPLAFAALYYICQRYDPVPDTSAARVIHSASLWLLVALCGWESAWAIDRIVQGAGSWPAIGWALVPALALLALLKFGARVPWPITAHRDTYLRFAGAGIALYLIFWVVFTNATMTGDPYPLPYIPFINPLDIAEGFALLVLASFGLHLWDSRFATILAIIGFIWLNGVLVRTLHQWAGIPFELQAMLTSTLAQTSISIFWTVIALATMLIATRKAQRMVWISGAVLLAVVVAKLFLIDLSRVGTIERIVSFVGVGVLMLVMGYFSPLPPAVKEAK